jgi:hypothetical protein
MFVGWCIDWSGASLFAPRCVWCGRMKGMLSLDLVKYDAKRAYGLHPFLTSALDRGQWWDSRLGHFTPCGRSFQYALCRKQNGPQESVWSVRRKLKNVQTLSAIGTARPRPFPVLFGGGLALLLRVDFGGVDFLGYIYFLCSFRMYCHRSLSSEYPVTGH